MSIDAAVLRAMLRVARRREAADEEALVARVGDPGKVRAALRRLDASGLVERRGPQAPRLTMAGLAVAVGLLPAVSSRAKRSACRSSRAA
jgi:DNA-binding GntR family transcriptional regulator